jgi:hypothetical protein
MMADETTDAGRVREAVAAIAAIFQQDDGPVPHDHRVRVDGCFRCELSADETKDEQCGS